MERSTGDNTDKEIKNILAISNMEEDEAYNKQASKWKFWKDPSKDSRLNRARRMGLLPKRGGDGSGGAAAGGAGGRWGTMGNLIGGDGTSMGLSEILTSSPLQTLSQNMSTHYRSIVKKEEKRLEKMPKIAQVLLAPLYPNATLYNHVIRPILSPTLGTYFIASMASNDNRFNSESVLFAFPELLGTQPLFGALDEEESARRDQAQQMVRYNRLLVIAATSAIGFGGAHGSGTPPILLAFATPSTAFQTLLNTTSTPEGAKSSSWTFQTLQKYRSFCALSSILSHPSIVTTRDLALLQRVIWNRVCELESNSIRQNHLLRTAAAALQQQQQGSSTTSGGSDAQQLVAASNEPPASLIRAFVGILSAVDKHLINHGLPFPSFGLFIDESWNGAIRGEFLDRLQWVKPFLEKWRELEVRAQYFVKTQTTDMSVARALHSQYGGEEGVVDTSELDERELEIIHLYGYQYFNGIRYGTAAFCAMALYVRFMSRRRDRGTWVMERCRRELELAIDAAEAATRSGKVQPAGKLFEGLCAGRRLLEARHIQRRDLIANLQGANMADGHTKGLSFYKKILIRGIPKYGVDTITHPLDWRLVPPSSASISAMLLGTSTSTSKIFLSNAANNTAPLQLASPLPMLCEPEEMIDETVDGDSVNPSTTLLEDQKVGSVGGVSSSLTPFDGVAIAGTSSSHQLLYLRGTPVERSVAFYTANRDPEVVALRKRTIIDHAQRLHQQLILALTQTCPTPEDVQVIPVSSGGAVGGGIDRKLRAHVVDHNDVTFASDVRLIEQHLKELEEEDDLQGDVSLSSSPIDSHDERGEAIVGEGGTDEVVGDTRKHPLAHAAVVSALKKRPLLSENLARISGNNQDESATFACYQHIQTFDSSFRPPFPDAASKGKSEEVAAVLKELYKPDPKLGQYSISRRILHYVASLIAGETTLETASENAKPIRKNTPHKTNVIDRLQPGLMRIPRHPIQSIKILFRTPLTHFNTTTNDGTRKLAVEHSRFESQGLFSFMPFQREKRDAAIVGASGDAKDPATVSKARAALNVLDVNSIKAFPVRLVRAIAQRSTRPFHVPIAESGPKRSSTDEEIETFALEDDFYSKAKQRRAQQLEKRAQQRRELDDAAASTAASATQYIEVETNNFVADDESPQPHQLTASPSSSSSSSNVVITTPDGDGNSGEVALRTPEPLSMYHPFPGPPTLLDATTIQSLRRYYGTRRLSINELRNYWRLQVEVSRFGPNMLERDIDALYRGAVADATKSKSKDDKEKNDKKEYSIPFTTRVYLWAKYPPFSLLIAFIIIPTLIVVQMCRWYLAHLRCREIQADEDDLFNLQKEAHLLQQVYGEQEEEMDSVEKEFSFGEANDATYGTAHLPFSLVDRVRMLVGGPSSPLSQALAHDPSVGVSGYTPSPALWWLAATSDSTLQHRSASRAATTTTSPGLREVVDMVGREQRRELQWGLSQIWSTRQRIVEGADQPDYFTSKEYFDVVLLGRVPQYHLSTVIGANLDDSPQSKKRKESNRKQLQQLTIMTSTEMLVLRKDQQVELIRRSMKEGIEDSKRAAAAETGGGVEGDGSGTGLDGRIPGADMVIHRPTGRILPSAEVSREQWAADPYVYFEAGFAEGAITSLIGTLRDVYLPDPAPRWVPMF